VASTCNSRPVLCVSHRSQIRYGYTRSRLHSLDFLSCLLCAAAYSVFREMVCCSERCIPYASPVRIVCTHPDDPQCAARASPGTNQRPPLHTPGPYPMHPLPLCSLAVCRNASGTPAHSCCLKLGFCLCPLSAFGMVGDVFWRVFPRVLLPRPPPPAFVFSLACVFFPGSCAVVSVCGGLCRWL
jgi:hypothetical protein